MTHEISAQHLTIERVGEIINQGMKLALSDDARNRIIRCRQYLDEKNRQQSGSRLWRDHRFRIAVQSECESRSIVATANQLDEISRLWRGRPRAQ